MKKVLVAMSGGVDSSTAAILLKNQGYNVTGVTFKLWKPEGKDGEQDIQDAKKVCEKLNIEHIVLDWQDYFKQNVVEYFINQYKLGNTPNPCVECNKKVKFGLFWEKAKELGFDYIATGHYAKIIFDEITQSYKLTSGADKSKDQTYFLYNIPYEILEKIKFPLSEYVKPEVRGLAERFGLEVARKKDSQEICFIDSKLGYVDFLLNYTKEKPKQGNFVDLEGNVLCKHNGIWNYTIGQRKGLGGNFDGVVYVVDVDVKNNNVVIGKEQDCYSSGLIAKNVKFITKIEPTYPLKTFMKIRYRAPLVKGEVFKLENGEFEIVFDEAQKSVAKGQSVVFYDENNYLVGGGIIK